MNTLERILKQDLVVVSAKAHLETLQKLYVTENQKYKKDDTVKFREENKSRVILGVITKVYFHDFMCDGLIHYHLYEVDKKGERKLISRSKMHSKKVYAPEKNIIEAIKLLKA